ncbi:MAG: protein phosphatase 2C domain-containing protein [Ruminococcus sp.]|nr:protein phosphatase 2C domain-containing protein [Ruminococcus sp.]
MNNYSSFSHTFAGAFHVKNGIICQDYSMSYDGVKYSFVAVADGHGSPQYIRTDRGARLAVQCAYECTEEFMDLLDGAEMLMNVERKRRKMFSMLWRNVVSLWYDKITNDYINYPFTEEELNSIPEELKEYRKYYKDGNFLVAYGTTLEFFVVSKEFAFGVQIGDGKCVIVADDGSAYSPIPDDPLCNGNITSSMCQDDAVNSARFCYFEKNSIPPAVFIGTDGVDKSCWNDEQLYDLYRKLAITFAEKGFEEADKEMSTLLPEISANGVGDDISCAGILNISMLKTCIDELRNSSEEESTNDRYDVFLSTDDIKAFISVLIEDTIASWDEPDIYAISLFMYDDEDNPCKPTVVLGYNTESEYKRNVRFADSPQEARWNYVFWLQNNELSFGTDDTAKIVRQWIISSGYEYNEDADSSDSEKYSGITRDFTQLLADIVQELHSTGFIVNTFGKDIPVLIHNLEYNVEIADLNMLANCSDSIRDFVKFCHKTET